MIPIITLACVLVCILGSLFIFNVFKNKKDVNNNIKSVSGVKAIGHKNKSKEISNCIKDAESVMKKHGISFDEDKN